MHIQETTRLIKEKAFELGFSFAGFTTPEPPSHVGAYEAWLARGFNGEMAYLAGERGRRARADIRFLFPECRTVLCLGWPYAALQTDEDAGRVDITLFGHIASYAWGMDYHLQLVERMEEICLFIGQITARPFHSRIYTDSGPILERDYAQRAGLGWAGKHTNLIAYRRGSYFLLAEILVDIDLYPDDPFTHDYCGECHRCMDACPTKCILPGRILDARRCIAYLTIEHRSALPLELRPAIGNRIFGCDICQQICPWNERFVELKKAYPPVNLIHEMALTPERFRQRFRGGAVERARRSGYLRNVAVALGNSRNPEAEPALDEALRTDEDPLVRGHAAWALGRLPGQKAHAALSLARRRESNPKVIAEIQLALEGVS